MTQSGTETGVEPSGDLALLLFSFDLETLEAERMTQRGVHFVIAHRHSRTDECAPGEEIAAAWIVFRGKEFQIPLSTKHLILFDYLCRHRGIAQTATRIAKGLNSEPFYLRHAANASEKTILHARTSRTAIKQQIMRVRSALKRCFGTAHIPIKPNSVLRSARSSSNEVLYRICATVLWEHY